MLLHVIALSLGVVAQSLKPVRLLSRLTRTVAEQCLIRLHSSSNVVGATHVYLSNLKWTRYVDYINKKANKGLYSLRVLKQCGAPQVSLAKVFVAIVRPVLQHAVSVWQNIPEFLLLRSRAFKKGLCVSYFLCTITMRLYLQFLSRP